MAAQKSGPSQLSVMRETSRRPHLLFERVKVTPGLDQNEVAELQRAERAAFERMNALKQVYSKQTAHEAIAAEDEWFRLHELLTDAQRERETGRA
jgi:hypothetical protein